MLKVLPNIQGKFVDLFKGQRHYKIIEKSGYNDNKFNKPSVNFIIEVNQDGVNELCPNYL